ncbi:HsdM family class I SAM-dependent methyltransferase [Kibdelosporangium aridum]|uniref:site-specific DNA-methyltransferase (adenine-specific) n=1 Tax=Kibdelosporangium aridum TaxID=2030 RepID=A0A1Y5YBD5_KIBAR|nr:N-6 DNA Methylase [Kibdelosporangium aridum]
MDGVIGTHNGDTLRRFRKVLSNPPFSLNYRAEDVKFSDRMMFGWAPETGKKADLMFVQRMVSVLTQNGIAATVMPHGVLFRGGAERAIREKMLQADAIEAIIGLGPNLFYGTGIPACVLVVGERGQLDQPHPVREGLAYLGGHPQRQPGLADPGHPGQRDQPRSPQQPRGLGWSRVGEATKLVASPGRLPTGRRDPVRAITAPGFSVVR